jgi:hypothetical protein
MIVSFIQDCGVIEMGIGVGSAMKTKSRVGFNEVLNWSVMVIGDFEILCFVFSKLFTRSINSLIKVSLEWCQ